MIHRGGGWVFLKFLYISYYTIYSAPSVLAVTVTIVAVVDVGAKSLCQNFIFTYESIIHTVLTVFINYCHVSSEEFLRSFFHLLSCVNAAAI